MLEREAQVCEETQGEDQPPNEVEETPPHLQPRRKGGEFASPAWQRYAALLEHAWFPGDDERERLEERELERQEAETAERLERTGTEYPPVYGDLDFPEEDWTDEETLLARLGLESDDAEAKAE